MEGIKFVKSETVHGSATKNGVVFIDLPLTTTILLGLSALKYTPAHDEAFTHLSKQFYASGTDEGIRFQSSINVLTKGRAALPIDTNLKADVIKVYSFTTFIPVRKRSSDKVHPAKMPLKC